MSTSGLSADEVSQLNAIVGDLNEIFDRGRIEIDEIGNIGLESEIVAEYLEDLRLGSEPESALKDKLVTSASVFARALFGRMSPELSIENGIVDYRVQADNMPILLEIKPPFEAYSSGGEIQRIQKRRLNWRTHEDQIERYRGDNEYLIFTNLDKWVFFSKRQSDPIAELEFREVYEELQSVGSLRDYLERIEGRSERDELDASFFEGLDTWRDDLGDLTFQDEVSERERTEAIINFINKFIFIQTLDDHFVVEFNWIEKRWQRTKRDWERIGRGRVLEEFLDSVNEWFYAYYDTELFEDEFLGYLESDEENMVQLYELLPRVLGLEEWQQESTAKGITNFNYRQIDADIFGKAYETSLSERREEEGIYYTQKNVTRYMAEQTVGQEFDEYVSEVRSALEDEDFERAKDALREMVNIRVVDPACGSGSFLIKAFDVIWERYQELVGLFDETNYLNWTGSLEVAAEDRENANHVGDLETILGGDTGRELVARIVLRHIYGNDRDADALSVAKVNLWLESIKKVSDEFQYSKIPRGAGHTLPNLELNLQYGDALVGLPDDEAVELLSDEHPDELRELSELRRQYLADHTNEDIADELLEQQAHLSDELDNEYRDYLENEALSEDVLDDTIAQHWPVGFWHAYFDDDGQVRDSPGFDVVLGNPPYINAIARNKHFTDDEQDVWGSRFGESASGAYDMYLLFLQLGLDLGRGNSRVSFIVPNKHLATPYAEGFRTYLVESDYTFESLTDVSQLEVFDEPSVYPVIPVYKTSEPSEDTTIRGSSPPTQDALGDATHDHCHDHGNLNRLDENIWSFLLLTDDTVFWDIYDECQMLSEAGTVQASSTASEAEKFTTAISEDDPTDMRKKFIKTGAIDPLLSRWEFEEVRHQGDQYTRPVLDVSHDVVTDLREEQYTKPKLIFAKVASIIEAFPDVDGSFASVDTNLFYDADGNLPYYAGVLNSYVAEFLYAGLFGALRMRGGDFQYQAPQLRLLPIPQAEGVDDDRVQMIEDTTRELLDRNHHRELLFDIWTDKTELLSDESRSISTILERDKNYRQEGNRDLVWSSDVAFYPDADRTELDAKHGGFLAQGTSDAELTIYGLDGQSVSQLYEIEFRNRALRDHVLAAMELTLFRTRKKVESLRNVLEKTEVPVIRQDSAENTPNIVEEIEQELQDEAVSTHSDADLIVSTGALLNEIHDLEVKLNGSVLDAYSVSDTGAEAVLDNVGTNDEERTQIVSQYDDIRSEKD